MEHTNTLCGQNAENLYIETSGTLNIKGLIGVHVGKKFFCQPRVSSGHLSSRSKAAGP
jgi:hypothetical protein